jgi:hypothetical protein
MCLRVALVLSDISEDRIASIFRVEKWANEEPACADVYSRIKIVNFKWKKKLYIYIAVKHVSSEN